MNLLKKKQQKIKKMMIMMQNLIHILKMMIQQMNMKDLKMRKNVLKRNIEKKLQKLLQNGVNFLNVIIK